MSQHCVMVMRFLNRKFRATPSVQESLYGKQPDYITKAFHKPRTKAHPRAHQQPPDLSRKSAPDGHKRTRFTYTHTNLTHSPRGSSTPWRGEALPNSTSAGLTPRPAEVSARDPTRAPCTPRRCSRSRPPAAPAGPSPSPRCEEIDRPPTLPTALGRTRPTRSLPHRAALTHLQGKGGRLVAHVAAHDVALDGQHPALALRLHDCSSAASPRWADAATAPGAAEAAAGGGARASRARPLLLSPYSGEGGEERGGLWPR